MKKFNFSKGLVIGLLTLALCLTCFGYAKVSAEEKEVTPPAEVAATYVASSNTITASSKYVVYVLKQEKGNTIKAGTAGISSGKNNVTTIADLGIKNSSKDVYLYVCSKDFEEEGKNINANLVIKAQAAKKIVGTVDYTKADGTGVNVISVTATDSNKKAIDLTENNITILWSKDLDGTYKDVNAAKAEGGFTGDVLKKMLEDGGGMIYVKMQGKDGGSGDAQFTSQAVKVKIAKPAKAPAVKLDAAKDALSIKNGFDFGAATVSGKKYSAPATWYTILPVLATAETKTADDSIVPTTSYKPLDKKDSSAKAALSDDNTTVSYTQYKFKNLSVDVLMETLNKDTHEDLVLAIRKSATNKKPASEITYVTLAGQTYAPIVYTASKVKGQYLVATSDDFAKKGITIGTIANYPGTTGSDDSVALATTGFDSTFKIGKAANNDADGNAATYEYLIVKTENFFLSQDAEETEYADLSSAKWKKFDPAKLKLTSKLKSKYSTLGGKAVEATLKAMDLPDSFNPANPALDGTIILVRRAGVKGKTVDDSVRASLPQVLYVIKNEKTFELYTMEDIGDEAWQYKVQFAKYDGDESTANKYIVDNDMTLTGWVAKDTASKNVEIAKPSGFDYLIAAAVTEGKTTIKTDATAVAENASHKYVVTVEKGTPTVTYCLKQYANIVINIEYDTDTAGDGKSVAADKIEVKAGKIGTGSVEYFVGVQNVIDVASKLNDTSNTKIKDKYAINSTVTTDVDGVTCVKENSKWNVTIPVTALTSADTLTITLTVKLENCEVSFDANGGTGTKASIWVPKGAKLTAEQLTCTFTAPTGKVFDKWSPDVTTNTVIDSDKALKATWKDKE